MTIVSNASIQVRGLCQLSMIVASPLLVVELMKRSCPPFVFIGAISVSCLTPIWSVGFSAISLCGYYSIDYWAHGFSLDERLSKMD
jgi:hypothetical protein